MTHDDPLLRATGLRCTWPAHRGRRLVAVHDLDLELAAGEALAVVGESGCGKSTLARALLWLDPPTRGDVTFEGTSLRHLASRRGDRGALRAFRAAAQLVFQDSLAALDPRLTVAEILNDGLALDATLAAAERDGRRRELLERCELGSWALGRRPHELSGGQRQRVGIARALATRPRLLVLDEPTSSLDVSVQARILSLLAGLRGDSAALTTLIVSHDLAVVRALSHRILVMNLGRVMEAGPTEAVLRSPAHPYTRALIEAVPRVPPSEGPELVLSGELPSALDPPPGCPFQTRCPGVEDRCRTEVPELRALAPDRKVACHFAELEGKSDVGA